MCHGSLIILIITDLCNLFFLHILNMQILLSFLQMLVQFFCVVKQLK